MIVPAAIKPEQQPADARKMKDLPQNSFTGRLLKEKSLLKNDHALLKELAEVNLDAMSEDEESPERFLEYDDRSHNGNRIFSRKIDVLMDEGRPIKDKELLSATVADVPQIFGAAAEIINAARREYIVPAVKSSATVRQSGVSEGDVHEDVEQLLHALKSECTLQTAGLPARALSAQ